MIRCIVLTTVIILFTACSGGNGGGKYDDPQEDPEASIESPYDEGTGHDAGFQWAEEKGITDPSDCGGDSDSFIEGCEEYAGQNESDPSEEMPYEDGR